MLFRSLRSETEVVFGWGTSPDPSDSLDLLFEQAGQVQERIVFRPAVAVLPVQGSAHSGRAGYRAQSVQHKKASLRVLHAEGIPFIQIP